MKKFTSILLATLLILSICGAAMLTVGAEETTSDAWDGSASIKWYLDGPNADGDYELKTAEDLAGLAFLVGAAQAEGRYTGVYYSADGIVAGYKAGTNDTAQQDNSLIAKSVDGLECVNGDTFFGKTVVLTVDVVLNDGDAEDWATTAPLNTWQPIGGNILDGGGKRAGFDGTFDGQGHTISGLYYKSTTDFGGLFGVTGQQLPATIKNLKLTNCYVYGQEVCGVLVGRSSKGLSVNGVYVSDSIVETTGSSASAIIGTVFGGAVEFQNSAVENVTVKALRYAGIFTGMTVYQDLEITDCYVKNSSVTAEGQVGLVCGRMAGGNITLRNVYAIVTLAATGSETATNSQLAGAGLVYGVAGDNVKPGMRAVEGLYHVSTVAGAVINEEMADQATAVQLADITGEAAKTTMADFDFETVWKTVEGDTPVIELRGGAEGGDDGDDDDDDDFLSDDDFYEDDGDGDGEINTDGSTNTDTGAPQTDTSADNTQGGCGSMVGLASVAMIAIVSGAAIMLKKEK